MTDRERAHRARRRRRPAYDPCGRPRRRPTPPRRRSGRGTGAARCGQRARCPPRSPQRALPARAAARSGGCGAWRGSRPCPPRSCGTAATARAACPVGSTSCGSSGRNDAAAGAAEAVVQLVVLGRPLQRVRVPPAELAEPLGPVGAEVDRVDVAPVGRPVECAGSHPDPAEVAAATARPNRVVPYGRIGPPTSSAPVSREHLHAAPHVVGGVPGVCVGSDQDLATGRCESHIHRCGRTSSGIVQDDDPAVDLAPACDEVSGGVTGTAVHHQDLGNSG